MDLHTQWLAISNSQLGADGRKTGPNLRNESEFET